MPRLNPNKAGGESRAVAGNSITSLIETPRKKEESSYFFEKKVTKKLLLIWATGGETSAV